MLFLLLSQALMALNSFFSCSVFLKRLKVMYLYYLELTLIVLRYFHQFLTVQGGIGGKTTLCGATTALNPF